MVEPTNRRRLRRWGPVVLVVAAVVAGVVVATTGGGGGGNEKAQTATSTKSGAPAGAISFSEAQERSLDVTFPDTCDQKTGRVAIPFFFAPECYANVADNGGATSKGVTADTITVVVYVPPENDPVLDFIQGAAKVNDTPAQVEATYQGFTKLFGSLYQTYGRTVQLKFLHASGNAIDEVAARADAVKAATQMGAFAVWGGPALTDAWADELAARHVIVLGYTAQSPQWMQDRAPYVYSITANADQVQQHLVEYLTKEVAGRPASHAGQDLQGKPRTFGLVYIESTDSSKATADKLASRLHDHGVELAERIPYTLDPARLQEQAVAAVTKLRDAGVTSVIFTGDPVAPKSLTEAATAQGYFPEWIIGGSPLVDTAAFGRSYDQAQWAHAFGISTLPARQQPEQTPQYRLYQWFHGRQPPAQGTAGVIYPEPAEFFNALQAAGPHLTPQSFRDGLFTQDPTPKAITQPSLSFGKHGLWSYTDWNGIDDATELWWDPNAKGKDEVGREGTGLYRYVDMGARYLPGKWPEHETTAFQVAGTVTVYDHVPPAEQPPDYPSPAASG